MEAEAIRLETERLLLRPWREEDAEELYKYAQDPDVGLPTGWPPHTSVRNSREVIRTVLAKPNQWAVEFKETGQPVGSIGLMAGGGGHLVRPKDEAEIGYWLGKPYWGRGLIPEAVRRMQRYAFEELGMVRLWCGYFDGNEKSKRAQEKCGFVYHHTLPEVECPLLGEVRMEHFTTLSKAEWEAASRKDQSRTGAAVGKSESGCETVFGGGKRYV